MILMSNKGLVTILIADDDEDDRFIVNKALSDSIINNPIDFVEDGQELMDYLQQKGKYKDFTDADLPGIILLDLNMPRKDGREALAEIKADPRLRLIPVIVLTTSQAEQDILKSYEIGAASFISKPVTFIGFLKAIQAVGQYWLNIVELPHKRDDDERCV